MIKGSDIPAPLLHAFVDALEAWGRLERELFMTWQLLNGSPDIGAAWNEFCGESTSGQRKMTVRVVKEFRTKTDFASRIPEVFDRLVELTRTRDRIVHGRWHSIELVVGGRPAGAEYIRLYDARNEPSLPVDTDAEQRMLRQSRFYEAELRDAERQFRDAARDIHHAKADMVGSWQKWAAQ